MNFSRPHKIAIENLQTPTHKKNLTGGIYRMILKERKILMYKEVHEFFETAQNRYRKPTDEFLLLFVILITPYIMSMQQLVSSVRTGFAQIFFV